MKRIVFILLICSLIFTSCDFFKTENPGVPVARVNNNYLYETDIAALVTPEMTPEDSTLVVNGFITRWATQQLLIDGAKRNIDLTDQQRLDALVNQYKTDLYSQAYKDALVEKSLDSAISDAEVKTFYEQNEANFRLNEELLKLRFIQISDTDYNLNTIREKFIRFNEQDKKYLDSISVQFQAQSLNDSIWVSKDNVINTIKAITLENEQQYLKITNFLQLRDSLGLYLIAIKDKLNRNEYAPLEYVVPTVRQIILNKRKLELVKQLEKDITKDAIKNKQFEIYN
ncbi:MAG: peptidyl-prolyl cis-trans isomerase [Leeuwenhoekiella sp.]